MASARDIQFFNTLFKAVDIFYRESTRIWAPVTWNGRSYYIYKKQALRLFRFLMPQFRVGIFQDDNNLVRYLYEQKKNDRILVRLTLPGSEQIITEKGHQDFENLGDKTLEQQERGFNEWMEKHTGEKEQKTIGGGGKPLKIQEDKEKEERQEEQGQVQISLKDIEKLTKEERIPTGLKTAASQAQIGARNVGEKAASGLGNLARDAASGLLRGGGSLGARVGNFALQAGIRGVAALAAGGLAGVGATVGGAIALAVVIVIAVLVFVPMFQQQVKDESLLMTGVAQAAPVPPPGSGGPAPIYTPGGGSNIVSCPVNNGRRTTGSKETHRGHCSASYGYYCVPPGQSGYTGRDTAVDVQGSNTNVFLPNLGGQPVQWTIDESGTSINDSEGGGIAVGAFATHNGHTYRIRFVHIVSTGLGVRQRFISGTLVGGYNGNANHVHITLQEDGVYKPADLYFNLCG